MSPWFDAVPAKKRPAFPAFRGHVSAPLVVIGGGLAGCMTAYACAAAGLKVILLEAGRIGQGGTARASGFFDSEGCASFPDIEAGAGRRAARAVFELSRHAPRELALTVKRLGIPAHLHLADALRIVPAGVSDKAAQREAADRQAAGLYATWQAASAVTKATGIPAAGGVRLRDWGLADPYRLALGFAAAATKKRAKLFEHSRVNKITFDRKVAVLHLDAGTITTPAAVHCTGEPTDLVKALKRHFRYTERYTVATAPLPATVRAELGARQAVVCDTEAPPHRLFWTPDHRAVFSGADQKRPPARLRDQTLVQRTGQLMYELSRLHPAISGTAPTFGWDTPLALPTDDVLYAGSHRNFPHQLFALGTAHSPARAFLASRILLRSLLGQPDPQDQHFSFARNL